jgi:1,4-dihydroxy-6-naphthoate synthase
VARILHRSIQYAREYPDAGSDYIRTHAQEMENEVIRKHIDLFVNDYTLDLGPVGRAAVETLMKTIQKSKKNRIFVPSVYY